MNAHSDINIEELKPPLIFPDTSEEAIFADLKARMIAIDPAYEATLELESEAAAIILQAVAYRLGVHQRDCNEGVLQQLLAFAQKSNLDWQGQIKGVGERHKVEPGDPTARPPVAPKYETDAEYRRRIQLAPEGYSTAGPIGAYIYNALKADAGVKDATAFEDDDASVVVPILSSQGSGVPSVELIAKVQEALNALFVRPLNDHVRVMPAEIVPFQIDATLYFHAGPDRALAFAEARARLLKFVAERHRLGDDVPISGIYAALHIPNVVSRVDLRAPLGGVAIAKTQAAYCNPDADITLIDGGIDA